MAIWNRKKVSPTMVNSGKQYVNKVDSPSADDFNAAENNAFYAVDFAEALADAPDISETGNIGTPSVTLVDNIKNVNGEDITYKKFKFNNMKGEQGASLRNMGAWATATSYSANAVYIDIAVYENTAYLCKLSHTSSASILPTNTTYWEMISNGIVSATISGMDIVITFADGLIATIPLQGNVVQARSIGIDDSPTNESSNLVRSGGVYKIKTYDIVIHTQAEFDAMIASPTWLDAVSVALVGQFTRNDSITIPQTVKQIHGFSNAKITLNVTTGIGSIYGHNDCTIQNIILECTGNALAVVRGITGFGVVINCKSTVTSNFNFASAFEWCVNLVNCKGIAIGVGSVNAYAFEWCTNLVNCNGKGTSNTGNGYGFANIRRASNCEDDGSTTNMWTGDNLNIDMETCKKSLSTADNAALNS